MIRHFSAEDEVVAEKTLRSDAEGSSEAADAGEDKSKSPDTVTSPTANPLELGSPLPDAGVDDSHIQVAAAAQREDHGAGIPHPRRGSLSTAAGTPSVETAAPQTRRSSLTNAAGAPATHAVAQASTSRSCSLCARLYCKQWRGNPAAKRPGSGAGLLRRIFPAPPRMEMFASFLGSLAGMCAVAALHYRVLAPQALAMVIASFAASAVLLYGVPAAPLAQPRNVLGGHILGALIGVTLRILIAEKACGGDVDCLWFSSALSVALTISLMELTGTVHPPGGATAFIAVVGDASIQKLGYLFVLLPVLSGAAIMLLVALFVNNAFPTRQYPQFWV